MAAAAGNGATQIIIQSRAEERSWERRASEVRTRAASALPVRGSGLP